MKTKGAEWDEHTMTLAARGGKDESVTFLLGEGCAWDKTAIDAAARGGHVKFFKVLTLKFMVARGKATTKQSQDGESLGIHRVPGALVPWDEATMNAAAKGGNVDILKMIKKQGFEWSEESLAVAILAGQLAAVKHLVGDGAPWQELDAHTCAWNHDQGHIVEWLEENIQEYRGASAIYGGEDRAMYTAQFGW
jgi:hypothetical protein